MVGRISLQGMAAALLVALASPGLAAESEGVSAPAAVDPAYLALYSALVSGVDQHAQIVAQVDAVVAAMVAHDALIERLAAKDPTFKRRLAATMVPFVERHSQNLRPAQQQAMTALMARHMTPSEAQETAKFYLSPMGRKALGAAQQNASYTAIASSGARGNINADAIRQDLNRTMADTRDALAGKLSVQEQAEMLAFMRRPAFRKLIALMGELPAVRARLESSPMDPALQAEGSVAVATFMLKEQGLDVDAGAAPAKPKT